MKYAGFWIRFVANTIDGLVSAAPMIVYIVVTGNDVGWLLSMLISWIYSITMLELKSATLGKMIFGIQVLSVDGGKLSLGNIFIRETIGKFISGIIFMIGYVMAAFTEKKQALHDMMARSVVVYKDNSIIVSGQ